MSRRCANHAVSMLELWRAPAGAGEPVGCLATTYTFDSMLFEEQCLGRFLGVDALPEREGLVSMLERENALGGIYAGVLVDHGKAGVAHSLRWDVLGVRIPSGIQHAKLAVLAWRNHVRLIVSSANLTEPGYRSNLEVATAIELTRTELDRDLWTDASEFLRQLLAFTPATTAQGRALAFLKRVEKLTSQWRPLPAAGRSVRRRLVCTLPARGSRVSRSALSEAIGLCQRIGGRAPVDVAIASPFFDRPGQQGSAMQGLAKAIGHTAKRRIELAVPSDRLSEGATPRLLAPRDLLDHAASVYECEVVVSALPAKDADGNERPWHAKLLRMCGPGYVALMIGSSNFTTAGLGSSSRFNAEANLLTLIKSAEDRGEVERLRVIWPRTTSVPRPGKAEWADSGAEEGVSDEELGRVPAGFVAATFRASTPAVLELRLDVSALPAQWSIWSIRQPAQLLLASGDERLAIGSGSVLLDWQATTPPDTLQVRWDGDGVGILPVNVEDPATLAAPTDLEGLDSEAMLRLLAATNPTAELRQVVGTRGRRDESDAQLDAAAPPDLDPLRRFDLRSTFLYRVRARARLMEGVRTNLERPVWSESAFEWRLMGMIGPYEVARRVVREAQGSSGLTEALLAAADLLIVLREVRLDATPGGFSLEGTRRRYAAFRRELAEMLDAAFQPLRVSISKDILAFWDGIIAEER